MVVKAKVGRRRYIIFKINTDSVISKRDLIYTVNNISKQFRRPLWVIQIWNNYGLIRCHHIDKEKTINILHTIEWVGKKKNRATIQTLGTTGTIRSARKKYLDKLILYPLKNSKTK